MLPGLEQLDPRKQCVPCGTPIEYVSVEEQTKMHHEQFLANMRQKHDYDLYMAGEKRKAKEEYNKTLAKADETWKKNMFNSADAKEYERRAVLYHTFEAMIADKLCSICHRKLGKEAPGAPHPVKAGTKPWVNAKDAEFVDETKGDYYHKWCLGNALATGAWRNKPISKTAMSRLVESYPDLEHKIMLAVDAAKTRARDDMDPNDPPSLKMKMAREQYYANYSAAEAGLNDPGVFTAGQQAKLTKVLTDLFHRLKAPYAKFDQMLWTDTGRYIKTAATILKRRKELGSEIQEAATQLLWGIATLPNGILRDIRLMKAEGLRNTVEEIGTAQKARGPVSPMVEALYKALR